MTTEPADQPRLPRLPHYIELWAGWTDEAERLEKQWDDQKRLHLARFAALHPRADPATGEVDWENTRLAQGLLTGGKWAHRKAQTFGLGVLILTLRQIQRDLRSAAPGQQGD